MRPASAVCFLLALSSGAWGSGRVSVDFTNGTGLTVQVNGVPVIQGSGIQFYAPGWTKGYFSTSYSQIAITKPGPGKFHSSFRSDSGEASGTEDVSLDGNTLNVTASLTWSGKDPAKIELTGAQIWGPAIFGGTYDEGSGSSKPFGAAPKPEASEGERQISGLAKPLTFHGPWGSMTVSAPSAAASPDYGWTVFDARGWPRDWTKGQPFAWFGAGGIPISAGKPVTVSYSITFEPASVTAAASANVSLKSVKVSDAEFIPDERLPIIPFPKYQQIQPGPGLEITGAWELPVGHFLYIDDFFNTLKGRFLIPKPNMSTPKVEFDGGLGDLKLPKQAYTITVSKKGISVLGEDDEGLRIGLRRLALLAYTQGGHVYVPYCTIKDWPSDLWRGFHLFGGPEALKFQQKLTDRVLAPLGFNHAIIQCGRTAWDALPNVRGSQVMSKSDLKSLFNFYKGQGIEAAPMIESFGHAAFIFQNDGNIDLSVNPSKPYTLDPRKPGTSVLLHRLWGEAIDLLHPSAIHFGSDEAAMIGFPNDGPLLTSLWRLQMPIYADIASSHKVKMMLWGDEMLGPGQAPDACNAPTLEAAAERRAALPKGTIVTDWHYKADPKFTDFLTSLDLFKQEGMTPIASTWYEPDNIAGFTAAAVQAGCGTLQTTWSGYYSSQQNVLDEFDQFAAFVLSAEYAWSGRQDPPSDLNYNYRKVFWNLFCQEPLTLQKTAGTELTDGQGAGFSVGRYHFGPMKPVEFRTLLDQAGAAGPDRAVFTLAGSPSGTRVLLAAYTAVPVQNGDDVARITVHLVGGKTIQQVIKFGWDVRTRNSDIPTPRAEIGNGESAVSISLGASSKVQSIEVESLSSTAGLAINGITVLN